MTFLSFIKTHIHFPWPQVPHYCAWGIIQGLRFWILLAPAYLRVGSGLLGLEKFGPMGYPQEPYYEQEGTFPVSPNVDIFPKCVSYEFRCRGAIEPQFYAELLRGLGIDAKTLPNQMDMVRFEMCLFKTALAHYDQ